MRSQVYEWDASRTDGGGSAMTAAATTPGTSYSIFIGGYGNNITTPARTTATQFVVIEDIGVTPSAFTGTISATTATSYRGLIIGTSGDDCAGGRNYVNVRINTTNYFQNPDNVGNDGVPGAAAPYPRSVWFQPSFNLFPDVYVLPGQTWDVRVIYWNEAGAMSDPATAGEYQAFVKYTLYDGPDALIANKLLEMGITVNPGNVDWYKRTLISGGNA